jgi:hypothetical protein
MSNFIIEITFEIKNSVLVFIYLLENLLKLLETDISTFIMINVLENIDNIGFLDLPIHAF